MSKPLTADEIRTYENRLRSLRASLSEQIDEVQGTLEESGERHAEREDEASEETAVQQELEVTALEGSIGEAVEAALERIRAGTYGRCDSCGQWISKERLNVIPYAVECTACARRHQAT
jgi:RNA polymerase-binding transcription factor